MSGMLPPAIVRPAVAGAVSAGLLVFLGGRGVSGMSYARQAGAGAVAVAVSDWWSATYGDDTMGSKLVNPLITGAVFAGVNKMALGAQDSWGTLVAGGVVIDIAASWVQNPLANALGL